MSDDRVERQHAAQRRRFDVERRRADELRRLRQENEHLARERARLERILALILRVACNGNDLDPLVLLAVTEELDEAAQRGIDHERLLALLRPLPCERPS